MDKGLEVLKGQSRERSDERFGALRTQRAWWESGGNDQWNRVAGSYSTLKSLVSHGWGLPRAWDDSIHAFKRSRQQKDRRRITPKWENHKEILAEMLKKESTREIKIVEPVPLAWRGENEVINISEPRTTSFIPSPFCQNIFIFYSIVLKIAAIYGVPGKLRVLCLLIPSNSSKRQELLALSCWWKKKNASHGVIT